MSIENELLTDVHILLYAHVKPASKLLGAEFMYLKLHFCGKVVENVREIKRSINTIIYFCGNALRSPLDAFVIKELSYNITTQSTVSLGAVPINISGAGIMFRRFFTKDCIFSEITNDRAFKQVTENCGSEKIAHTGLFLSPVERHRDGLKYYIQRSRMVCSEPLSCMKTIDAEITSLVNVSVNSFFKSKVRFNHIFADLHSPAENRKYKPFNKSENTKDMHADALIAYCTFYKDYDGLDFIRQSSDDSIFDCAYGGTSIFPKMRFKLKRDAPLDKYMRNSFTVTLYPNSLFVISLSTNRFYTHEVIMPNTKKLTRVNYTLCSSKTWVLFRNRPYIYENGILTRMDKIGGERLEELCSKENNSSIKIDYPNVYCSLSEGDYKEPKPPPIVQ
jgi:hypothetical protein